jgi:hypothetical protein
MSVSECDEEATIQSCLHYSSVTQKADMKPSQCWPPQAPTKAANAGTFSQGGGTEVVACLYHVCIILLYP